MNSKSLAAFGSFFILLLHDLAACRFQVPAFFSCGWLFAVSFEEVKIINRTVYILSLVSLFADVASEMLYPVVPVYLKEIGFSVFLIGVLEGIAEFTAGLSKGYFGKRSDESGRRLPFIRTGYFFSALSKPLIAVATFPAWIFGARTLDRLGKGLRTAARDALLSANATPQTKARVFAFHRGMDTLGAVAGPLLALAFLSVHPGQYPYLFYLAALPGLLSVALLFLLWEVPQSATITTRGGFFSFLGYWREAGPDYKKLVRGLVLFTLINSSDVFLLLKTRAITGSDTTTILAYVFYNCVYAIASYPLGILADRYGFKQVFVTGLLLFSIVYFLFALSASTLLLFVAFFIYGLYAAATEGISKAWLTNLVPRGQTGTAIGLYTSCQSLGSLAASLLAGTLWSLGGAAVPFFFTALAALLLVFYFGMATKKG